ncbi:MAG: hypothetical protein GY710_16060, partial [Desulfobacteraceae bacterium]|nr:hypothetical protein [Desulfobacteraceae bacterium]
MKKEKDPAAVPGHTPVTVRADVIDYRDTGKKGHPFLEISDHPDLRHAVEDFTATGWEEDAEVLMKNCYLFAVEETGTIPAVGVYVRSAESRMPVLTWIYTHTADTETRYHE